MGEWLTVVVQVHGELSRCKLSGVGIGWELSSWEMSWGIVYGRMVWVVVQLQREVPMLGIVLGEFICGGEWVGVFQVGIVMRELSRREWLEVVVQVQGKLSRWELSEVGIFWARGVQVGNYPRGNLEGVIWEQ